MAPPPMLGKKRQASLLDANSRCMSKCKDLITKAVVPGIEYAHECKQLQRFAKSLLIPLEDLSDNVFTDAALEKKGMDSMCKVEAALDRGLKLVETCAQVGRLQALLAANTHMSAFANVAQDFQESVQSLNLKELGCDEITLQQVKGLLEQLAKVQAALPEKPHLSVIKMRQLAETQRVELKTGATKGADAAKKELRELVSAVIDGCAVKLIVMDRTVLRAMKEEAELNKDYVDLFFCDVLLSLIREVLDDSVEPQGADLTATVVIKERHVDDAPPLDLRDQFLAGIPALLDVLEAGLVPPSARNAPPAEGEESDIAPNKSPKQLEAEIKQQHSDVLLAMDDLLAITSDMPEVDLPMKADEIVYELLAHGIAKPLVQWLDVSNPADTRLKAAELMERVLVVEPTAADSMAAFGAVAKCIRALSEPEHGFTQKPTQISLKSGRSVLLSGQDTFTPKIRAARVLRVLCTHSEQARATLSQAPPDRRQAVPKKKPAAASSQRANRSSRLSEKVLRASEASQGGQSSGSVTVDANTEYEGGVNVLVQLLAKVMIKEHAAPQKEGASNKSVPVVKAKISVIQPTDAEMDSLKHQTKKDMNKVALKIQVAQILELLAEPGHSAILVAQGGLLAAVAALGWDIHVDINTACAMIVYKLASQDAAYLQMALEHGACAVLPDMTASEDPEEREAATKAVNVLMQGASTQGAPPPPLGASAAAKVGKAGGAGVVVHKQGGGVPLSSLFPLMQLLTLREDATLVGTLNTLAAASEDATRRVEMWSYAAQFALACLSRDSQLQLHTAKLARIYRSLFEGSLSTAPAVTDLVN